MIATISSNDAKVWDFNASLKSVEAKLTPQPQRYELLYCCWNHTNQVVALANSHGQINLCHAQTGQLLSIVPFEKDALGQPLDMQISSPIREVSFSANSRYIAHTLEDSIVVWDLKKRSIRNRLHCPVGNKGSSQLVTTRSLSFFPEGTLVSGDSSGHIQIWDVSKSTTTAAAALISNTKFDAISSTSRTSSLGVSCVRASTSGTSKVVASYNSGHLCVFDAATTALLRQQQVHSSDIPCVAFSPKNPRLVASAGVDGKLVLNDTGSRGDLVTAAISLGAPASTLSFHEDAIHTAVGTVQGRVLIYDWRNVSKPVVVWEPHSGQSVVSIAFQTPSPGAPLAATSSASSTTSGASSLKTPGKGTAVPDPVPASVSSVSPRASVESSFTGKSAGATSDPTRMQTIPATPQPLLSRSDDLNVPRASTSSVSATGTGAGAVSGAVSGSQVDSPRRTTTNSAARATPASPPPYARPKSPSSSASAAISPTVGASTHSTHSVATMVTEVTRTTHLQTETAAKPASVFERDSLLSNLSETTGADRVGLVDTDRGVMFSTAPMVPPSSSSSAMGAHVSPALKSSPAAVTVDTLPVTTPPPAPSQDDKKITDISITSSASIKGSTSITSVKAVTPVKSSPQSIVSAQKPSTPLLSQSASDSELERVKSHVDAPSMKTSTVSTPIGISPAAIERQLSHSSPPPRSKDPHVNADDDNMIKINGNESYQHLVSPPPDKHALSENRPYSMLQQAMQPVSQLQLHEELQSLRYDLHKQMQEVIREQRREIEYAKEDTAELIGGLATMLRELLQANEELRRENEKLRSHMLVRYQ